MNSDRNSTDERSASTVPEPLDLLRAMLAISPEDAAAVREDAAEAMKPGGADEPVGPHLPK